MAKIRDEFHFRFISTCIVFIFTFSIPLLLSAQVTRAPAYPLITHDPYFSIWSFTDSVNKSSTKHWTGTDHELTGLIRVDGKTYSFLGNIKYTPKVLVPTGDDKVYESMYTQTKPADNWMDPAFKVSGWTKSRGGFSDDGGKGLTKWDSKEIWVRRTFNIDDTNIEQLILRLKNDDDVDVYLNGSKIYHCAPCVNGSFTDIELADSIKTKLRKGKNLLALHCVNTGGAALLDAGFYKRRFVRNIEPAIQQSVNVTATATRYSFACGPVNLDLSFVSPLLMDSLELIGRPVSYIDYSVRSDNVQPHEVQVYVGASSNIAANTNRQKMHIDQYKLNSRQILKIGTVEQPVLQKKGDNIRIDWGYLYLTEGIKSKNNIAHLVIPVRHHYIRHSRAECDNFDGHALFIC